jgi:site-specific DNA-methyltransferase (adenine-specific)
MEATTDVWEIPPESATRVGHAAPFPVALPRRLIHLYTYYGDLVLDPFMGSGTTAVAAIGTRRHFAGYDIDAAYVQKARARVKDALQRQAGLDEETLSVELPAIPPKADPDEDFQARAVREGRAARDVAEALLHQCGFEGIQRKVRLPVGVEVNFRAYDRDGGEWFFDVSGGFTSTRPGLMRTDTLWKAVGKAAVLHEAYPKIPLVLLTTDSPKGGAGEAALRVVLGPGKPIFDVLQMTSPVEQRKLHAYAHGARPEGT